MAGGSEVGIGDRLSLDGDDGLTVDDGLSTDIDGENEGLGMVGEIESLGEGLGDVGERLVTERALPLPQAPATRIKAREVRRAEYRGRPLDPMSDCRTSERMEKCE
jgi:hypothetical protein